MFWPNLVYVLKGLLFALFDTLNTIKTVTEQHISGQ